MNAISDTVSAEYEAFLFDYNEPDLRRFDSTEDDLRRHMEGIKASRKGAAVNLHAAIGNLKKLMLPKWLH